MTKTSTISATRSNYQPDSDVNSNTEIDELYFELGLWLSGLDSFLATGGHSFIDKDRPNAEHDWSKEVRLAHSALLLCAKLNSRLIKKASMNATDGAEGAPEDPNRGMRELSSTLQDLILVSEALIHAEPLKFGVWKAWSSILFEKLKSVAAVDHLISRAERTGEASLPERLAELISSRPLPFSDQVDLQPILPRFALVLKWLSVVGKMLEKDEPLKPALLIFSRINEQTRELIDHINNRLSRFPDEEAELFGSLDGASYTASIEMRKVYDQELSGIVSVRPSLSIYARMETAYSLLNDSFQQILTGFARLIEPQVEVSELFPSFGVKLQRSLLLRQDLWRLMKAVQKTEKDPEERPMLELQKRLSEFLEESVHFLFYKDKESIERFTEEIFVTNDKKDLAGILHRFSTYLETLFGQVNMRAALVDQPFDPDN